MRAWQARASFFHTRMQAEGQYRRENRSGHCDLISIHFFRLCFFPFKPSVQGHITPSRSIKRILEKHENQGL